MSENAVAPKVAVIVPVYNTARYLPACLDSVLSQSLSDLEIIAVNDASTDDSPRILAEYAAKDPRIRILDHERNKGLLAARITGIKAAGGKYIQFLDSDDFLLPGILRELFETAERNNADIVQFPLDVRCRAKGSVTRKHLRTVAKSSQPWNSPLQGPEIFRKYFAGDFSIWMVCQKFCRADLCRKAIQFIPDKFCLMAEDFCLYSLLAFLAERYAPCSRAGYVYFLDSGISSGQKTSQDKFLNRQSPFQALRNVKDFLRTQNAWEEYREAFERQEQKLLGEYVLRWMRHLAEDDRFRAFNAMFREYDAFPQFRAFRTFFSDKDERFLEMLTGDDADPVPYPEHLNRIAQKVRIQEKSISPARWREWENTIRENHYDAVVLEPDEDLERLFWDIRAIRSTGAAAICRRSENSLHTMEKQGLNCWLMEDRVLRQASAILTPDPDSAEWYRKRNCHAGTLPENVLPPARCEETAELMLALEKYEQHNARYRIGPEPDGETFVPFFRKLDKLFRKLPDGFRRRLFGMLARLYNRIHGE